MVNSDLVLKLMEIYAAYLESFPRVLSAFVRRETLRLIDLADDTANVIADETNKAGRGRYLGEHLEDLIGEIMATEAFLRYFRDVPLAVTVEGEVIMCDDVRLKLKEFANLLRSVRERARRDNWRTISDEEFDEVKEQTHLAASDAKMQLDELDASLALDWIEPESEPDHGLE